MLRAARYSGLQGRKILTLSDSHSPFIVISEKIKPPVETVGFFTHMLKMYT